MVLGSYCGFRILWDFQSIAIPNEDYAIAALRYSIISSIQNLRLQCRISDLIQFASEDIGSY